MSLLNRARRLESWLFGEEEGYPTGSPSGAPAKSENAPTHSNSRRPSSLAAAGSVGVRSAIMEAIVPSSVGAILPDTRGRSSNRGLISQARQHSTIHPTAVTIERPRASPGLFKDREEQLSLDFLIKDPNRLPYFLEYLSSDVRRSKVLVLLQIYQVKMVSKEQRRSHCIRIYEKYFQSSSPFEIASALRLDSNAVASLKKKLLSVDTLDAALEDLQRIIENDLTKKELPRFQGSSQYAEMVNELGSVGQYLPLDKTLANTRAAHYFLLFLLQTRQHMTLFIWMQLEFTLKPVLARSNFQECQHAVRELFVKYLQDSHVLTAAAKKELMDALARPEEDGKAHLMSALQRIQQELFVTMEASLYPRFLRSKLYKALLDDREALEDSQVLDSTDKRNRPPTSPKLSQLIKQAEVPKGLQIHQSPVFRIPHHSLRNMASEDTLVELIVSFEVREGVSRSLTQDQVAWSQPTSSVKAIHLRKLHPGPQGETECLALYRRIQPFLVPDERLLQPSERPPLPTIFPFVHSVPSGDYYGVSYVYNARNEEERNEKQNNSTVLGATVLRGHCILSRCPILPMLRRVFKNTLMKPDFSVDESAFSEVESILEAMVSRSSRAYVRSRSFHRSSSRPSAMSPYLEDEEALMSPVTGSWSRVGEDVNSDYISALLERLGVSSTLQLLACALLECRILFYSTSHAWLAGCGEALRYLLRPLQWCHVYAPVLPKRLGSLLECPTPFIVGICSEYFTLASVGSGSPVVVVDLDNGQLYGTEQVEAVCWNPLAEAGKRLPEAFYRVREELQDAMEPHNARCDGPEQPTLYGSRQCTVLPAAIIARQCNALIAELLLGIKEQCLVIGDASEAIAVLDEDDFVQRCPKDHQHFLELLLRTQAISEYITQEVLDCRPRSP